MTKRIALCLLALFAGGLLRGQQTLSSYIAEDPERAAGVLHVYETFDTSVTPPPAGFVPFYVTHYGRHGSRYHLSNAVFDDPLAALDQAEEEGILTEDGRMLAAVLRRLREEHDEMTGILTQTGGRQHQAIAGRLLANYPEIFSDSGRPVIHAVSSTSQRCIQSMAHFCTILKGARPSLDVKYYTGTRFMDYISHPFKTTYLHERRNAICDSIRRADLDGTRLYAKTFSDPERGKQLLSDDKAFKNIHEALSIAQDMDAAIPSLLGSYFTLEELTACNRIENAHYFASWCGSEDFGDRYIRAVGGPLLADMVSKADEAVAGNDHAGDFRFGHDSALTPLLALIGVEGFESRRVADAADSWPMGKYMCMASNLQMVFFRDGSGQVLVKLLRNESETCIPGLSAVTGPYYAWDTLRAWLLERAAGEQQP